MFELLARADSIEERISTEEDVRIFWEAVDNDADVEFLCESCVIRGRSLCSGDFNSCHGPVEMGHEHEPVSCEDCILIGDPECYGGGDYRQCGRGPF